jgi:hypothetical protein
MSEIENEKISKRIKKLFLTSLIFTFLFNFIESRVKIISPPELNNMFGGRPLKASLSNFGNIPYGYNIVGQVYFNPDNVDDEMACKNITGIDIKNKNDVDSSPIVMIDR